MIRCGLQNFSRAILARIASNAADTAHLGTLPRPGLRRRTPSRATKNFIGRRPDRSDGDDRNEERATTVHEPATPIHRTLAAVRSDEDAENEEVA